MNAVYIAAGTFMASSGIALSFGSAVRSVGRGRAGRSAAVSISRNSGDVLVMVGFLFLIYGVFPFFRMHVVAAGLLAWGAAAMNDILSVLLSRKRLEIKAEPLAEQVDWDVLVCGSEDLYGDRKKLRDVTPRS